MGSLRVGISEGSVGVPAGRSRIGLRRLAASQREALVDIIQNGIVPATSVHSAWSSGDLDPSDSFRPSDLRRFREIAYNAATARATERLMQFLDSIKLSAQRKIAFLEATARGLGEDWVGDRRTFFDVTIAMGRVQALLRQLCDADRAMPAASGPRSVLLTCPPGEQHVFGLRIVEALFRRSSWQTTYVEPRSAAEIKDAVSRSRCDVICFSWSSGFLAEAVSASLKAISGGRRRPLILAGGYAAERNEKWLMKQGVDQICASPRAALKLAIAKRMTKIARSAYRTDYMQHLNGGAVDVPQAV